MINFQQKEIHGIRTSQAKEFIEWNWNLVVSIEKNSNNISSLT